MDPMEPTTLIARVYLTTDEADFLHYRLSGALAPHSVAEAATFALDLATGDPNAERPASSQHQEAIMAALETIFDELNEEPNTTWAQDYRAAGNRSLSVGDVVVLGETAWVVAPVGYARVSTDELATAIVPDPQLSAEVSLDPPARQWAQTMAERLRARNAVLPAPDLSR